MFDWPTITLKEAGISIIDCDHKTPKEQVEGLPYVGIPQLKNGRIITDDARLISVEDFHHWRRKAKPIANDIILSRRCNPGETAYVPENLEIALGQNLVLLRSDGKRVFPPFLRWISQGSNWWHQVNKFINVGAVFNSLKCADIPKFEFKLPPIERQKSISKILGDLDKKIDLNKKNNQTLEQITQAIFKSWFVDFEPTRAKVIVKQNGGDEETQALAAKAILCGAINLADLDELSKEPSKLQSVLRKNIHTKLTLQSNQEFSCNWLLEQLTAAAKLFPNVIIHSELGDIPKGWSVKALDEIAHYQNGLALQKFRPEADEESLPVLKIAQLKKGFTDGVSGELAKASIKPECIIENGDVVFSWSGSLMIDVWTGGKAALNQHLFKVTSTHYPKWFYFEWTKHHLKSFQQIAADKAVTMGHIKREHLKQALCVVPSISLAEIDVMNNLLLKQIALRIENTQLEELKDTLLPKLLSGELSVNIEQLDDLQNDRISA